MAAAGGGGVRVARILEMADEGPQGTAQFQSCEAPRLGPGDCRVPRKEGLFRHLSVPSGPTPNWSPAPPFLLTAVVILFQRPDAHARESLVCP